MRIFSGFPTENVASFWKCQGQVICVNLVMVLHFCQRDHFVLRSLPPPRHSNLSFYSTNELLVRWLNPTDSIALWLDNRATREIPLESSFRKICGQPNRQPKATLPIIAHSLNGSRIRTVTSFTANKEVFRLFPKV